MAEWLLPTATTSSGAVALCLLHSLLHLRLDQGRTTLPSLAPQLHPVGDAKTALDANITKGWKIRRKKESLRGRKLCGGV